MVGGGAGEERLGLKEEDAVRLLFGEEIMAMADGGGGGGFDGSAAERVVFEEVFRAGGNGGCGGMVGTVEVGLGSGARSKVVETYLLSSGCFDALGVAGGADGELDLKAEEHMCCQGERSGSLGETDLMSVDSGSALRDFIDAVEMCRPGRTVGMGGIDDTVDMCMEGATEDARCAQEDVLAAAIGSCGEQAGRVHDPTMPSDAEAVDAEVSQFGNGIVLSDPFVCHGIHYQLQSQSNTHLSDGRGQMVGTSIISGRAIHKSGQFVEPGPAYQRDDVPGCSTRHSGALLAVGSRRTLNRDLPDQLEAHAHRLLKDAGWNIKPRRRNDRAKMAYYFAAPQREAVVTSLTQAWKLCGQRLYDASGDSERGKYPMEWSDVDTFWKDLINTMAYAGKLTVNEENSLTLLQRWQLLDPFVAVVFINKKITVLQKRQTLRAVDSSTIVIDNSKNIPSENRNAHKDNDLLPHCTSQSILLTGESDCDPIAIESCSMHRVLQNRDDLNSTCRAQVKTKLCCTQDMNYEAADHPKETHSHAKNETEQLCSGARLSNSLVKRARKKSKRISDIEAIGLNGLYAQSFMHPTIGSNKKIENHEDVFNQETNIAISDLSNAEKVDDSEEPGICSAVSASKKHLNVRTKLAKPNGKHRNKQVNKLWSEGRIEELVEWNKLSETECVAKESGNIHTKKFQKRFQSLKAPSMRNFSEGSLTVSNDSNVLIELSHEHDATVLESESSLEAQSCKKVTTKRKAVVWEKNAKGKPHGSHVSDDDLLITAIIRNKDRSSCSKFTSNSVLSDAKKFRKLKSPKRGSRLLVRTSGKGGTKLSDGRQVILARKSVLCWLIATGFVTLKDVVQCRNQKNNKVVKDGFVTWDGILCNCCIKTLSISDFKAHAGCSLPKSSLNLFLQSGKSYTLCQLEAWSAEYTDRTRYACVRKVEEVDENDDTCGFCGDGGELLCCDNCPSTYHQACLSSQELPEGSWYCHNCICRNCGCPVSEKEVSSFSAILKCLQCGDAYHDTCIEGELMSYKDTESAAWFCGRYCKEIFIGLRTCVGIENLLDNGLSWTILRCNSGGQQLQSVQKIARMAECNTKLAVALTLMEECFVQMVDTRTGIDMIPHVLYNQGSNFARLDYRGFYTVILEKADEILCAASLRIHGTKAAELPFIATCAEYRRRGMCRRLMNTIEKMLRCFHVKMLVLSAIPELVSTWVSGFGFKPIEDDERKHLNNISLMLFPGTSLLTKILDETEAAKSGGEKDGYNVSRLPNGKASEHFEPGGLDLLELNTGKVDVNGSFRKLKDECNPAAWHHSAKLAIGEVRFSCKLSF